MIVRALLLALFSLNLLAPRAAVAACDEATDARYKKYIAAYEKELRDLEAPLDQAREQQAAWFVNFGRTLPSFDAEISRMQSEVSHAQMKLNEARRRYALDCGTLKPGSATPELHGAVVHSLAFERNPNSYALLSAPANWQWAKLFGDLDTTLHKIALITCPKHVGSSNGYLFECTYTVLDYAGADPNPPSRARHTYSGTGRVSLVSLQGHQVLNIDLSGDMTFRGVYLPVGYRPKSDDL